MMDIDPSKENIQPLRGGRNVLQLGVALQAQNNVELQTTLFHERQGFEARIASYEGDDPLSVWYEYILWIEQTYPKQGHEGNLVPLLEQCLSKFEEDERYKHDIRHCKLLIKYVDSNSNPSELLRLAYHKGLFRGIAEFYKAWAYYHELTGDYKNAHKIFELGKQNLAQPFDELDHAHQNLVMAAGQHLLQNGQVDQTAMIERRHALTSLRAFKPGRVGSIRNVATPGPGSLGSSSSASSNLQHNQNKFNVFEEDGDDFLIGAAATPGSILQAARRVDVVKENIMTPGPWTTVPVKKRHLAQAKNPQTPRFVVLEDNEDEVILRQDFPKTTLEDFSNWKISLTLPDPSDPAFVPMYPKRIVYEHDDCEYSLEEIRLRRYDIKNVRQIKTESELSFEEMDISLVKSEEMSLHQQSLHLSPCYSVANEQISKMQSSTQLHNFDTLSTRRDCGGDTSIIVAPQKAASAFNVYEESNLMAAQNISLVNQQQPKNSAAMKTPFKDLNAEELAETGSRGGMDVAAAAPVDSAKRTFESFNSDDGDDNDLSCNTQAFHLNLNNMRVSTPNDKGMFGVGVDFINSKSSALYTENAAIAVKKRLFNNQNEQQQQQQRPLTQLQHELNQPEQQFQQNSNEVMQQQGASWMKENGLSTILEETKSYRNSSSSSGAISKSSLSSQTNKQANQMGMTTISEEHNSYLAQNLMANAELRSSLFGKIGDLSSPTSSLSTSAKRNEQTLSNSLGRKKSNIGGGSSDFNDSSSGSKGVLPLSYIPSNPFKSSLLNDLLNRLNFPGEYLENYIELDVIPKLSCRKDSFKIGSERYVIEKELGRGTFGIVFRCVHIDTGKNMAIKMQRPPNKWEFYICKEIQKRLANHPLKEQFMDVRIGYFSSQASLLISDFMPYGSLLNVANVIKYKTGRSMKESLVIYFTLEMLKVVSTLHQIQIIHADIKPDNFLIQVRPNDSLVLQLIDFGCSIDMALLPPGASFKQAVTTDSFICCEMRDGKPWNYHTDLFCIAASTHVLLFDKYIQMRKTDEHWSITQKFQRYMRADLWNTFFSTLLNQGSGPADTSTLQEYLHNILNHKFDDYYTDLRSLSNILKNR